MAIASHKGWVSFGGACECVEYSIPSMRLSPPASSDCYFCSLQLQDLSSLTGGMGAAFVTRLGPVWGL